MIGGKLKLSREQRARLFAGDCPRIGGEGDCPVTVGYVYRLSPRLELEVTKVCTQKDLWWLRYIVHDRRHRVRNLRRTPTDTPDFEAIRDAFSDENFRWDELPVVREKGTTDPAEDSAYTTSRLNTVTDAGEGVDEETLKRFSKDGHRRFNEGRKGLLQEREDKLRLERLRREQRRARDLGDDPAAQAALAVIDAALDQLEQGRQEAA